MRYIKLAVLVVSVIVSACEYQSIKDDRETAGPVRKIDSSVEYVGPDNSRLNESYYPDDVVLMFPTIPGGIFGSPSSDMAFMVKVEKDLGFTLRLDEKAENIESRSSTLTQEWQKAGIVVEPAETRISRLGTFPYSYASRKMIGGGGFINTQSRNLYILVYVDRKSSIRGEIQLDEERCLHELDFPGKGFYWIEVIETEKNRMKLINGSDDGNIRFSVHIQDLELI